MNRAILMGRLTRDPAISTSRGQTPLQIARYTLAVERRGAKRSEGESQTADFIQCVAFGAAADFAQKYFRQGQRVLVSGRIQTGSYTNKDGQKVYTTDVIVDDQEFADSKKDDSGAGHTPQGDGFMDIPDGVDDDGLPFG